MKLLVLGPGCARCKALTDNAMKAVMELGIDADVEKVEDVQQMVKFGIMATPALVVDGKVKLTGRVASPDEIKKLLT